jgi:hypothetical protein
MGCVLGVILLITGVAVYLGYRELSALRDQFTETKPLALPSLDYSKSELSVVQQRTDEFLRQARNEGTHAQLALTARDINVLLSASGLSNRVYVTLTNSAINGQLSLPVDSLLGFLNRFGVSFLHGRYFNGTGIFKVACTNGDLEVTVQNISIKGKPLPEHYMARIRAVNFAESFATDPATRQSFQRIRRVSMEDERLIFEMGSTNH